MSDSHKGMSRSMLVVSAGVLSSRILGLVRDAVFARVWGTGTAMAAFVIAFTIPNLLRSLFGEGTFSGAFVPVFSQRLETEGKEAAWAAACRVVSVLAVVLGGVVILAAAGAFLLQGFFADPLAKLSLELLPGLMPYGIFVCMAGALGGALNSMKYFAVASLTPLLLNVCLIAAATAAWFYCGDHPERTIFWLIPAVLVAGVLHLLFHLHVFRRLGLRFRFCPDFRAPEVRQILLLMAPAVIGTSVGQINIVVDRFLAGYLGSDATSALYYSQRLIYLPVGLFGVASSVVSLPELSRAWARGAPEEMADKLRYALRHVLFLCLPMTLMLGFLGKPIIRLLFEGGTFSADSTDQTLWALICYVPGIPFFASVKTAASAFFARQDTRTPVKIAYICLALNVVLNLSLMGVMRQGGLALSTTISAVVNLWLLLLLLRQQTGLDIVGPMAPGLLRTLGAGFVMIAGAWLAQLALPAALCNDRLSGRILQVAVPLVAGYVSYGVGAFLCRCPEMRELSSSALDKILHRWRPGTGRSGMG